MIRLLTKPEVCEILAISRPTLDRIVADGDGQFVRRRLHPAAEGEHKGRRPTEALLSGHARRRIKKALPDATPAGL